MINPKDPTRATSPYEPFRGPIGSEYGQWAMNEFESFLEKYNELKLAYLDGDLRLKNVIIEEPYGYRVQFQVEIKNKVIREWWKTQWLKKSPDQRGTKTDSSFSMNPKKRRNWNRCYLDKLQHKVVVPYVFSFSPYWDGGWLTNGGHRVVLDERLDAMKDSEKSLRVIDFDYDFPYFDLEDGNRLETANLNGVNGITDIIDRIGLTNWKDKQDNTFHPVNIFEFRHSVEEEALKDHSLVFTYSNDNLKQIDLIHAVYSKVNNRVREISDWKAFEDDNVVSSLSNLWDKKKHYIASTPYEVMLRSLLVHTYGLVDNNLNALEDMVKDEGLYNNKTDWNKFLSFFNYSSKLYLKLNKSDKRLFKIHGTRFFEFTALISQLRGKKKRFNIIDEEQFLDDMVDVYRDLVNESDKLNNSQGSFYDLRSRSASQDGLRRMIAMILSKLIDKGSVVQLQKDRNIKDEEKSRLSNVCDITGQKLSESVLDYHHKYVPYALGGISDVSNVFPVYRPINTEMGDMYTSEFLEKILDDPEYTKLFTKEKLAFWKNGGMDDLKSLEGLDKYRFGITTYNLEEFHKTRTWEELLNPPFTVEKFL